MRTKKTEYKHILLWPDGTPTVSGTRLKVKHLAALHRHNGASAEELHQSYPSHSLAEIHSALAYYYDHKNEMDRQMDEDERQEQQLWAEIEARQGPSPTREQLIERLKARDRVR
jgi:uncharacterized protein (DUF433 family)